MDLKGPLSSSRSALLEVIANEVKGERLPGLTERSSGHEAGAPWQKLFGEVLGRYFEGQTFTQNAYLNHLFATNPQATTLAARKALIGGPARLQLLGLSDKDIKQWRPDHSYREDRQSETADFVVAVGSRPFIDVKSRNLNKGAAPHMSRRAKWRTPANFSWKAKVATCPTCSMCESTGKWKAKAECAVP